MDTVDELKLDLALQAHEKRQRLEREAAIGRFLMDLPVGVTVSKQTASWTIRSHLYTYCASTLEETIRLYKRQDEITGRWLPDWAAS